MPKLNIVIDFGPQPGFAELDPTDVARGFLSGMGAEADSASWRDVDLSTIAGVIERAIFDSDHVSPHDVSEGLYLDIATKLRDAGLV